MIKPRKCPVCGEAMIQGDKDEIVEWCINPKCAFEGQYLRMDYVTYADRLAAENAELRRRIDELRSRIAELEKPK